MKKTGSFICILICVSMMLTGCQSFDHMPNLSEEQSQEIAEYAAGLLLQRDVNSGRLASDEEIAAADAKEAERQANLEALIKTKEAAAEAEAEKKENGSGKEEAAPVEEPFNGIAEFYGLKGFHVEYVGHTISDSYPEDNGEDAIFALDAVEGNKLLVMQFMVTNDTDTDSEFDMFDQNPDFFFSVNEGETVHTTTTLLLDDLSAYKDIIPAGQGVMLVLIGELPTEEAQDIQSISLTVKNELGSATTSLE